MSEKISHSKGRQNPNSKNPAAGGGVRSLSSQNSPAVGNFASGCQASERSPFQKAVFSACSAMNLPVRRKEISEFAEVYASENPGLKFKFDPSSDVNKAKAIFQEKYSSQIQVQLSRNPDNLFGILLREGRKMRIENDPLIQHLKSYTTSWVSKEIAETPTQVDIIEGITQMILHVSPGGIIFQNVLHSGISHETLGETGFSKLLQMKKKPQAGHIWAIPSCPPLATLLDALCIKRAGPYENIVCSISGLSIKPNGEISAFKLFLQRERHETQDPNLTHMVGYPAIIWSTDVSEYRSHRVYIDPDLVNESIYGRKADGKIDFQPGVCSGNGQLCEYAGDGKMLAINTEKDITTDLEVTLLSQTVALKPTYVENLGPDNSDIREIPEYQNACNANLAEFGAVPLRLCLESSVASEASEAVLSKSDHVEEATRDCKHGKWGGGQVAGKCKDCDWGM